MRYKKQISLLLIFLFIINTFLVALKYNFNNNPTIFNSEKLQANQSVGFPLEGPSIRFRGFRNLPLEGSDLKSFSDEKFELEFLLDLEDEKFEIYNQKVSRVYSFLDYDTLDTDSNDNQKFEDGSTSKYYTPEETPSENELNPDLSFMGNDFIQILRDNNVWENGEKEYLAVKNFPERLDPEIFVQIKVLYKIEVLESNGWHSYYYYKTFEVSEFWTTNFDKKTLRIIDDDTIPPIISDYQILNSPITEAQENIIFEVQAYDNSGLEDFYVLFDDIQYNIDSNNRAIIPNPRNPGQYEYTLFAVDGDEDRHNDQLTTSIHSTFNIIDDDSVPPIISNVSIINAPILDNEDIIQFRIDVEDDSGLEELSIKFQNNIYLDDDNDHIITIPNPKIPGTYEYTIKALDNDKDREGDQLETTLTSNFEVFDDDITPPQIFSIDFTNEPFYDSTEFIEFEVIVEDQSGLSELYAIFNQSIYHADENNRIIFPNPILPNNYLFSVIAVDGDSDQNEDQLNATFDSSFEVKDDDINPPEIEQINILNSPLNDSVDFIEFEIVVNDASGIADLFIIFNEQRYDSISGNIIFIPNPKTSGIHSFQVFAIDGDDDWEGDMSIEVVNSTFEVSDDDINPPEIEQINILNSPIYDSADFIEFEIVVNDESGLSQLYILFEDIIYHADENNHIILPNPILLGLYDFVLVAIDNDTDHEGDQLNSSINSSFKVVDDDITPPTINNIILLTDPVYDSDIYFKVQISAQDVSDIAEIYAVFEGEEYFIDENNIVKIDNPKKPGSYSLQIIAIDNDTDRINDQLISQRKFDIKVEDDDTSTPIIESIQVLDTKIYDSSETIRLKITAKDESGLSNILINFMNEIIQTDSQGYINLSNPIIPGIYKFSVRAIDNDTDRLNDQLSTTLNSTLTIYDDDLSPPEINIYESAFGWDIMISDIDGYQDSKATGNYIVFDSSGEIWDEGIISMENKLYRIRIPFKPETYTLIVNATNNDNEWNGDIESISHLTLLNISLEDCFLFLDNEIEEMKKYVDNELYSIIASTIRFKLSLAQKFLRIAYQKTLDGNLTCSLFKDAIAQVLIEITEFETVFFNKLNLIEDKAAQYIISKLHEIRNFLVLLMGNSVDYIKETSLGYQIANTEVQVLNLKDYSQAELGCKGKPLIKFFTCAAIQLEATLFELSMDMNISTTLDHTIVTMKIVNSTVYCLYEESIIPTPKVEYIHDQIYEIIQKIQLIKSNL
ncbi:MAG: hypothetical protein GF317_02495 [Candidatus Lokiarchaeota archaeon]|nr:hypothetical protein [Candidatus Lokiarchaeota archaeon]MBD3198776.1 hypothetical protein [Candidatus Lokiarchaeota archaeon]